MVKVKAKIKLYTGPNMRKTPFVTGYRPLFDMLDDMKTSGMITLLDRVEFKPGDVGVVEISFLDANCSKGKLFHFYEAIEPLGEGVVIDVIECLTTVP